MANKYLKFILPVILFTGLPLLKIFAQQQCFISSGKKWLAISDTAVN